MPFVKPKKPQINDNIITYSEERRKCKNAEDSQEIRKYKKLQNKINGESKFARKMVRRKVPRSGKIA